MITVLEFDVSTGERRKRAATPAEVAAMQQQTVLPVPTSVSMRQAQTALSRRGLLSQVEQAIAAMPGQAGVEARIDWAKAQTVERSWPLVQSLGAALGLTDAQLDDLFRYAATL